MTYTITHNAEFNSLEITFDGKPAQAIRDALKALRFRWHGQKKVWYGYSTEEAVKAAIDGGKVEKIPAKKTEKRTKQDHVKIYWNGIKIDGGKLIRCFYSLDNNAEHATSVSISARDYSDLPRDILPVTNDTDIYTDYFDNDRAYITPGHPLYIYFRYAATKAKIRELKSYIAYYEKELEGRERWPGRHKYLRNDLETQRAELAELEAVADPGQPTAEDLAEIDRQRQEAENERRAQEHAAEIAERERALCERVNGAHLIKEVSEQFPIVDGEPIVTINWSEHGAFYDYPDDTLKLSIAAADKILSQLDAEKHAQGRGYDKTKFTITGADDNGEQINYTGRYDLGDGEGGLIQHIHNFGAWQLTHETFGKIKETPDETNDIVEFAAFLLRFIPSANGEEDMDE